MSAQDRTLDHYQELMTINATSHVLRAGRRLGVFDQLAEGQKTLPTLAEHLKIAPDRLLLLIESLIAIGIIEQYQEDYALSSTARLLCQYDADLDDATWERLADTLRADRPTVERVSDDEIPQERFDSIAATQWVHTPAAMQVAEILDLGPPEETVPEAEATALELLDLGCGSAVWSCAMGFRDPLLRITAIDTEPALVAANSTATSIGLGDRFTTQVGDLLTSPLKAAAYDLVLVAQRLHSLAGDQIEQVLQRCYGALKDGGKLVIIDSFRGPHRPSLAESLEALRMQVQTDHGGIPELAAAQTRIERVGFNNVQFTFIAASRLGLGLMVGTKAG